MPALALVPSEIVRKWQEFVNLLAEIMHVRSAVVALQQQSLPIQPLQTFRSRIALLRDRDEDLSTAACP
jgi:hypothetical protein